MKAAVIGAGHIGQQHLACLRELSGVEVVAVCDRSHATAAAAAERFGVPRVFTDHRAMLVEASPDVVHIGTPPASHFALALDALRHGAHVFVEKPVTTSVTDLESLIDEASARGRVLVEDHNYLFNETIQSLLRLRENGELGEVRHVEVVLSVDLTGSNDPSFPHPSIDLPGGIIAEYLSHMAYLAHAFVGSASKVRALWQKHDPNCVFPSDEMRALVEATRGTAALVWSANTRPDAFYVRLHGTRMRAEAHLFEPKVTTERALLVPRPIVPFLNGFRQSGEAARGSVRSLLRKLDGGPGVYAGQWTLIRRMYESLEQGDPPPISIADIRSVYALVAALLAPENQL